MLEQGSFPPVWTQLYTDTEPAQRYPYLPVLEQAINSAQPRPAITNYDQASLAISSAVYAALTPPEDTTAGPGGDGRPADPDHPRRLSKADAARHGRRGPGEPGLAARRPASMVLEDENASAFMPARRIT